MVITFSGLDGSGKSTLIEFLSRSLKKQGFRPFVLTMYDHIGLYALVRMLRGITLRTLHKKAHAKSPLTLTSVETSASSPLVKRILYKIFRSLCIRKTVFLFDIILYRLVYHVLFVGILRRTMIVDRYFYDSLVDIAEYADSRSYVKRVLRYVPVPDVPFFIDVDPKTSYARKGEFTLEYLTWRYSAYRHLFKRVPAAVIIDNSNIEKAKSNTRQAVMNVICQ